MKKYITIGALFVVIFSTKAQYIEQAILFSQENYLSTSRTAAMGGAFSALGGDFGSISINPAATGVFRKSTLVFTPEVIYNRTLATLNGGYSNPQTEDNRYKMDVSNLGLLGSWEINQGAVKNFNLAIGYNRLDNFDSYQRIEGRSETSMLFPIVDVLNSYISADGTGGIHPDDVYFGDLNSSGYGPQLAWNGFLVDTNGANIDAWEYYEIVDTDGNGKATDLNQLKTIDSKGYTSERYISGGINLDHKIYIGASLNFKSLDYNHLTMHSESFLDDFGGVSSFDYYEDLNLNGKGFQFKIGLIARPIPILRLSVAFHSPTFYSITEDFVQYLYSYPSDINSITNPIYPTNQYGSNETGYSEYKFQTPSKINGGIGIQIGKMGLISADVDYIDYSTISYRNLNLSPDEINYLANDLKSVINYRLGGEYRIGFTSLRAGYGYYSSPEPDFDDSRQNISFGIGFGFENTSVDFAYVRNIRNSVHGLVSGYPINNADLQSISNHFMMTVGFKF